MERDDRDFVCVQCGQGFRFSNGERDFYLQNQLQLPKRCRNCRGGARRGAQGPSRDAAPARGSLTRHELLTLELQVEVRRAAGLLAIGFFTIFFAGMGCLLAGLSLIFAFWDSQRILVSVLVTAFFFLMASLGAWKLSSQLRRKPPMLADTLGELKKDSDGLRGGMRNGS